jgi:protein YIPF1/2
MMPSSLDDEDEFSVNPFRTNAATTGGIAMTSTAPMSQPASEDPFYSHPPNVQQQQQQSAAPQGPPQWSQQAPAPPQGGPDPHSGMTGSFSPMMATAPPLPPTTTTQQQSSQQQQYLSGTMDRRHDEVQSTNNASWLHRCTSCFRIEGYQPYFDLDTAEFLQRLQASLTVWWQKDGFRTTFLREDKPDLYGPLWIVATLVFVLAATSNMAAWAAYTPPSSPAAAAAGAATNGTSVIIVNQAPVAEFEYDIHRLWHAATVLATFFWGYPSFLWLACACLGIPHVTWPMWMAVYGYSSSVYLFAFVVCVVPWGLTRFIVLACATFMSGLLVLGNLSTPLLAHDATDQAKASPIILSMMGAHFVLLLVLKIGFFS